MNLPKIAYKLLGLPIHYYDVSYEDTALSKVKADILKSKIEKAPMAGVILVSGIAAPIVNHFLKSRKVVGLNFPEYYQSKLSNEASMDIPRGQVILIHGVGSEPANNSQFASKILGALLNIYKGSLVIIETDKTPSNFQTTYSLVITNVTTIPEKEVEKWL